ncbi:MAG: IS30 family transposase [Candidatus Bathyarchaeota archaeon]|nr:IS30 family transposase [Candidatus Bathyarchaeota archaeon]
MSYTQLTQTQRYQIHTLLKMGHNQTEIADCLIVHKSTICRELRRNQGQRGYRPKQAHTMALNRKRKAKTRIKKHIWQMVEEKLSRDWSPEQISIWLKKKHSIHVSHERIYQYILRDKQAGGKLYSHLRCQKKRRKRYGSYDRRGNLPNRVSIDQRPEVVDQRTRFGDWEVDTILGKGRRHAIVTLTERKSRLALLRKVDRRTANLVGDAVIHLLRPFGHSLHTITGDNGKEFAEHERISRDLQADFYFAHPYSSWERGSNENMNGLIRQYIPKDRDLNTVSNQELDLIMHKLNHRPRKCLDFNSPFEVFFEHYSSVALET